MAKKKKKKSLADRADKFACYQASVQSPDHEVDFFIQAYQDAFGETPIKLREDFCGTFAVCCSWVASDNERTAIGVDLAEEPLLWGQQHNLAKLTECQQKRVRILQQDVRKRNRPQVDVLAAQNFSFWIFKTRREVIDYFKIAKANMSAQSILVMDMMGGGQCYDENHTDVRTIKKGKKGFKYYWKQDRFNPITADARFYIGFKFADGSKIKKAFEYNWRFWTIPEVQEMLLEAGFSSSKVYWETEYDDGDTEWKIAEEAESDPSWICYIVAIK